MEAEIQLKPLYEQDRIDLKYVDLFETFGPARSAPHALSIADKSFDTILCWETMEHFNFNPVKFVRELHRVLKPAGRICVTVPNKASFQSMVELWLGRGEPQIIDSYYQFEDYQVNGKKGFYGFHWREYSPAELRELFARAGFKVRTSQSFVAFRDQRDPGVARRTLRALMKAAAVVLPRHGTHVGLDATREK